MLEAEVEQYPTSYLCVIVKKSFIIYSDFVQCYKTNNIIIKINNSSLIIIIKTK